MPYDLIQSHGHEVRNVPKWTISKAVSTSVHVMKDYWWITVSKF